MIELPEALTLAAQLEAEIVGKTVERVCPPTYEHKFTWFHGGIETYDEFMKDRQVLAARGFGIYVELEFSGQCWFDFHDGVNVRFYTSQESHPERYQLMIRFTDGSVLAFTVAMYGGFACHEGEFDNKYYLLSKESISPLIDLLSV